MPMDKQTYTREEPAGFIERAGVRYYRRLFEKSATGEAETIRIDNLPPDNTLRFLSRDISHFAAVVAFFIGACTSLATVWIVANYSHTLDTGAYYALLIGATLLLVIIEFGVLFWLSLRTVHVIACLTQHHRDADDPFLPGDDAVSNLLARAALELPDPVVHYLGVDPLKYVSKPKLFLVGFLYKAKVFLTSVAAKFLLRRMAGKLVLRIGLAWVSVPVAGIWNALVMYRVAREARLRLFGHRLVSYLIDDLLTEEFVVQLSKQAKEGAIRAISTMMVMTQNYHPNMLMLLVKFSETLAIEDQGDYDDWPKFVWLLSQVTAAERYFLLDLLCVAAAFDAHLSSLQRQQLPLVFGEYTDQYMHRIKDLKGLMLTGRIHAAKELCRLDFQPG
jgi:hypothetical protein